MDRPEKMDSSAKGEVISWMEDNLGAKAIETYLAKAEQPLRTTTQRMPENDFILSRCNKGYEMEEGRRVFRVMIISNKSLIRTLDQGQSLELGRSPPGLRKKRKTPYSYRNKMHSSNQYFGKHFKFEIHTHEKRKPI